MPNGNGHNDSIELAEKPRFTAEVGHSGLVAYGGQVQEEFDPDLRGIRGVRVYDEMRKNNPTIAMGLRLIRWILMQVQWRVEPGGETAADKKAAEFLESCMKDMTHTWSKLVSDILTCLPFGWSYFEIVYKQRDQSDNSIKTRYDDGRIGWKKIKLLGQDSLDRWELNEFGETEGMWQQSSMINDKFLAPVFIPMEKAVLFRIEDEKDNPEGTSLLRSCYLPWYMMKQIQEIEAIGIERDLTGVLIIHLPNGATQTDYDKAMTLLEQFKADDMSGFVAPRHGNTEEMTWKFEIINSPGNKTIDTDKIVNRYKVEIATNFLAQFLLLGQNGTGSWALSRDQSGTFELALGAILQIIEETTNQKMVVPLFKYNDFGTLTALPQIKGGRIGRRNMDAFAKALVALTGANLLTPDRALEDVVREEMELPELSEDTLRSEEKPQPTFIPGQPPVDPNQPGQKPNQPPTQQTKDQGKPEEDTGTDDEKQKKAASEPLEFHLQGQHNQASHGGGSREFGTAEEGKKFLDNHYGDWRKGLSKKEDMGMTFYQSPGYELMNGQLRGIPVRASEKDMARAKDAIKGLDSAIAKAPPLTEHTIVYRGFSALQFDLTPGSIISDKGYVSTSLTRDQAGAFVNRGNQALARIFLPEGTKAAGGLQKELVLPRNSKFKVVSSKKKGKTTEVELELIP